MKLSHLIASAAVATAVSLAPAQAGTVLGSQFTTGANSVQIDGITWQSTGGTFTSNTAGGFTGVGISGITNNEVDITELLIGGSFNPSPRTVLSFTVGLLYDGPEFNDVQEVARVTFQTAGGPVVYTLTNTFDANTSALPVWTGPGTVTEVSGDEGTASGANGGTGTNGAVYRVSGINLTGVTGVEFTALAGLQGNGAGTNQSDYILIDFVTAVPEPATLALLGAGLLGLGFAARRRKAV